MKSTLEIGRHGTAARPSALAVSVRALLVVASLGLGTLPLRAEEQASSGPSPVTSFTQQYDETRKALAGLRGKIGDSVKAIEGMTKPEAVAAELDRFMSDVSDSLAALSDNGPVATGAETALSFAQQKLQQFQSESRFGQEDRETLQREWRRTVRELEDATGQLTSARRELVQLLGVLQTKRDVLTEWQIVQNAQGVVAALKQLTAQIREASEAARGFLRSTGAPQS